MKNLEKKLAVARDQLVKAKEELKELVKLDVTSEKKIDVSINIIDKKQHEIDNIKFIIRLYEDLLK